MTFDNCPFIFIVPMEGLEPPHLAASDPKSDVSANFTTWAFKGSKSNGFNVNDFTFIVLIQVNSIIILKEKLRIAILEGIRGLSVR